MSQENNLSLEKPNAKAKAGLPMPGVPVWVQCPGFRTMAFRDAKGAWRTVARGQELKVSVEVIRD